MIIHGSEILNASNTNCRLHFCLQEKEKSRQNFTWLHVSVKVRIGFARIQVFNEANPVVSRHYETFQILLLFILPSQSCTALEETVLAKFNVPLANLTLIQFGSLSFF